MLPKILYAGELPDEVKENLKANADRILDDELFLRPLSDEEVIDHKTNVTESYIKLQQLKDRLKAYSDEVKSEMKPVENSLKHSAQLVKTGYTEETGTVYLIADHDDRQMGYYDETGLLIRTRPLRPEERQVSTFGVIRNLASNS